MDNGTTLILWGLFLIAIGVLVIHIGIQRSAVEGFVTQGGSVAGISLTDLSTQALDAAPTTSEVKEYYKSLLIFCDADIRQQGTKGLRILADFRDRVYGPRDFRANLTIDDFLGDYPSWLPPISTEIKEPIPSTEEAVNAELRMLAYLQKNYPQESLVDEQTGSTLRNLIEDFGYRFVFIKGQETVQLPPDFLTVPLVRNWSNPAARM
jgi:hypothetical protein